MAYQTTYTGARVWVPDPISKKPPDGNLSSGASRGVYSNGQVVGPYYNPAKTTVTPIKNTGRTDGRTWRADANAWMTDGEYAAWRTSQNQSSGGGGGYTPTAFAMPQIDLPVPDYSWNPTEEQRQKWKTIADANMALKYDPQRNDIINTLANFKTDAEKAKESAGRSNTSQQIGFANMVKNTGQQPIIDSAIRRGAETGGWLEDALSGLGQYETTQRGEMTKNYNTTIDDLVNQVLNMDTTSGKQLSDLSALQGSDLVSTLYQLENTDRTYNMDTLSKTFENKYNKAALINNIAAEVKRAEQQDALIAAQMAQQEFENNMSTQQFALTQAKSNYQKTYSDPNAGKIKITTRDGQVYWGTLNDWLSNDAYNNPVAQYDIWGNKVSG